MKASIYQISREWPDASGGGEIARRTRATVKWAQFGQDEIPEWRAVFALFKEDKPVYFGFSFHGSSLRNEIKTVIKNKEEKGMSGLEIWIGYVKEAYNTENKEMKYIKKPLVDDIKKLLTYVYDPDHNIVDTKSYNGRYSLMVRNEECKKLHRILGVEDGYIFYRSDGRVLE